MPFVKVCALSALPLDSVLEVVVGDSPYAICNVESSGSADRARL